MKITGTDGRNSVTGTSKADNVSGLAGPDRLFGHDGNDTVLGGDGADVLDGGDGNDLLFGHSYGDASPNAGRITAAVLANIGSGAVSVVSAPGDKQHLYALNKESGVVSRIDKTTGAATVFLDIPQAEFSAGGERGVLNIAFHPDYGSNGRFFVYLTNSAGDIEVREYARSPDPAVAQAAAVRSIITVPHPGQANHNGGAMAFDPDGNLYLGLGDGGGRDDPGENAQDTNDLLGKILRLDVDGDDFAGDASRNYAIPDGNPFAGSDGAHEIFALGFRNPFRFSFDGRTGDLYVGDVGQDAREEVDFIRAGTGAGRNFGWDFREGTIGGPSAGGDGPFTDPLVDYGRDVGKSITGGAVYRGTGGLSGAYFYADFVSGHLFTLRAVTSRAHPEDVAVDVADRTAQVVGADISGITSFHAGKRGALYVVTLRGDIIELTPDAVAGDGNDTLYGRHGDDTLSGGFGDDTLSGGKGNDTLMGGVGHDDLRGDRGFDTVSFAEKQDAIVLALNGTTPVTAVVGGMAEDTVRGVEGLIGGSANDILTGDVGANLLVGGKSSDLLDGSSAKDTLAGGRGSDTLTGGSGVDQFVFSSKPGRGTDSITDFADGDRLVFGRSSFATLDRDSDGSIDNAQFHASRSGLAHDRSDRIIYDKDDGTLFYDPDGNGARDPILIATLAGAPHLSQSDILIA